MKNNTNKKTTLIARNKNRALPLRNILIEAGHNVLIEPVFSIKLIKHKNLNYKGEVISPSDNDGLPDKLITKSNSSGFESES